MPVKKNELKACPFCGDSDVTDGLNEGREDVIRCCNCGAIGPWANKMTIAIELWNTRHKEASHVK